MRVYKRKDIYYVDYIINGKRTRRAVGSDKRIAEQVLHDIELKQLRKEYLGVFNDEKVPFEDYAKQYLEYSKQNKAKNSYNRDTISIGHLIEEFGDCLLGDIKPQNIENYKNHRREKVSGSTVNRELACLSHMFNLAIRAGAVSTNPLQQTNKFKEPPGRVRYLSIEKIDRLIEVSPKYLRDIIITVLNSGMRKSEVLGLTWEKVDLDKRIIQLTKTKNNKIRFIPINRDLFSIVLIATRKRRSRLCIPSRRDSYSRCSRCFNASLKLAEIEDFRFHDLRHTFASHFVMTGYPIQALQQILGHSSLAMTMRYSHLADHYIKNTLEGYGSKMWNDTNMAQGGFLENPDKSQT